MPIYKAPQRDMHFVLHELLDVESTFKTLPKHAEIDRDTLNAVLEEGAKFCEDIIFPLNKSGDEEGCHHDKTTFEVTTPKGYKEAYAKFVEGGWPALGCEPDFGGQGLPQVANTAFYEMGNSANQAWLMYPGLTHGAYECLLAHGSDALKQTYLPKLTSGEDRKSTRLNSSH